MEVKTSSKILYRDRNLIVAIKPPGVDSEESSTMRLDMVNLIRGVLVREERKKKSVVHGVEIPYVGVVHRLDRPVSGVMVYALDKKSAASLSDQFRNQEVKKEYVALVRGKPEPESGMLVDELYFDARTKSSVITEENIPGKTKTAKLQYQIIEPETEEYKEILETLSWEDLIAEDVTMLRIMLFTGRRHQIRVQMAHHGTPVLGDTRYGDPEKEKGEKESLALCAWSLDFAHPLTGRRMHFTMQSPEIHFK